MGSEFIPLDTVCPWATDICKVLLRVARGDKSALGISANVPLLLKRPPDHPFWKTSSLEEGNSPDTKGCYSCQVGEMASFITTELLKSTPGKCREQICSDILQSPQWPWSNHLPSRLPWLVCETVKMEMVTITNILVVRGCRILMSRQAFLFSRFWNFPRFTSRVTAHSEAPSFCMWFPVRANKVPQQSGPLFPKTWTRGLSRRRCLQRSAGRLKGTGCSLQGGIIRRCLQTASL